MKRILTKLSLSILLFILIPQFHLFSQTVDVYPKSNFSVNDTLKISFTIDSLLKTYSLDEIFTSDIKIVFDVQNVNVKKISPGSLNYISEEWFDITERVQDLWGNLNIELTQTGNENVFVYNSHKTLSEFLGLEDNEFLIGIELSWNTSNWWMYWKINNDEVFEQLNSNSNSISISTSTILITPFDNLKKNKSEEFLLSNYINNNLGLLIEENTNDLLLEKDSTGETVFSQSIGLRNPIVDDFNGDGINDIVSQIYQYNVGGISTILTNEEKEKLISRWGVFLGTESNGDSLVYEMGFRYDQKSEGSFLFISDINNDGFPDLLSNSSYYHGIDENRPDYYIWDNYSGYQRPSFVYINDGNGNFSVDSLVSSGHRTRLIQLDNDQSYEFIYYGLGSGESIRTWDYDENGISDVEFHLTDYQYINDFLNYDINKDGFQDVIVLSSDVNDSSLTITLSCFYGSEDGVNLNKENNVILYQFDEPPHVHLDDYPMTLGKLNEETDLIVVWILNNSFIWNQEYEGEYQTSLRGFKITEGKLVDVSEDVFPDNLNINKINPPNPPFWVDMDGDGLTDLYFHRETWFKGTDPISISYFKNNGTFFEPRHFSTFDISLGGYPSDVHFLDIDSDGMFEMIFDKRPWFEPIPNMDMDLCFYPFEVIYNNESPSDINLSNTSIVENSEEKTVIGTLSSVDSDTMDSHIYYLVPGNGESGNQYFTIKDNKLLSNVMFDFETRSSYSIRIQTEDGKGGMYSKSFIISVNSTLGINEYFNENVKVYPNPISENSFTIETPFNHPIQLHLLDIHGRIILSKELPQNTNKITLEGISDGLYFIQLIDGNKVVHQQKIIKRN